MRRLDNSYWSLLSIVTWSDGLIGWNPADSLSRQDWFLGVWCQVRVVTLLKWIKDRTIVCCETVLFSIAIILLITPFTNAPIVKWHLHKRCCPLEILGLACEVVVDRHYELSWQIYVASLTSVGRSQREAFPIDTRFKIRTVDVSR